MIEAGTTTLVIGHGRAPRDALLGLVPDGLYTSYTDESAFLGLLSLASPDRIIVAEFPAASDWEGSAHEHDACIKSILELVRYKGLRLALYRAPEDVSMVLTDGVDDIIWAE